MHNVVHKHPQPITSIFGRKLIAMQRADGWATVFCFRIVLFPLWWRLF